MSKGFQDHFSGVAATYAESRPRYHADLFLWLADQCVEHDLAWDCGTGNGQAARHLANSFAHVVATDASATQIAKAEPHPPASKPRLRRNGAIPLSPAASSGRSRC